MGRIIRGRAAVVLNAGGDGADFGIDTVTPVPFVFGVVVSQNRDGTRVHAIETVDGKRVNAGAHVQLLPPGIYACGMRAAIRGGSFEEQGVATVQELRRRVKALPHSLFHRGKCARHDLRDGCECDSRGWRR